MPVPTSASAVPLTVSTDPGALTSAPPPLMVMVPPVHVLAAPPRVSVRPATAMLVPLIVAPPLAFTRPEKVPPDQVVRPFTVSGWAPPMVPFWRVNCWSVMGASTATVIPAGPLRTAL